jgi:ABC-type multidrug transport system fused ATPase/permease subunit
MEGICYPYTTVSFTQTQEINSLCFTNLYLNLVPNAILSILLLLSQALRNRKRSSSMPGSITSLILSIFFSYFLLMTTLLFFTDYHYVSGSQFLSTGVNIFEWVLVLYCYQKNFRYGTWGCSNRVGLKIFWVLRPLWLIVEIIVYLSSFSKPQELSNKYEVKTVQVDVLIEIFQILPLCLIAVLNLFIFKQSCGPYINSRYEPLVDSDTEFGTRTTQSQNRYENATIFSKISTFWILPVLRLGYQRPLEPSDIEKVRELETTEYQKEQLRPILDKHLSRKDDKYAVLKALYSRHLIDIIQLTIIGSLATLMDFSGAIFIKIIENFLESDDPMWRGYGLVVYLLLSKVVQAIANNHYRFRISLLASHVKSGLSAHIFDKTLKMAPSLLSSGQSTFTYAQIINLMQVDLGRIAEGIPYTIRAVIWPFQFSIGIYLIYATLGWQALVSGILLMLVLFGINGFIAKAMAKIQKEFMEKKDTRMKIVNEWLSNMKVFKLYNWEKKIAERVYNARENEEKLLSKGYRYLTTLIFLNWGTRNYLILAMILTVTFCGNELSPGDVFTGTAVISILNMSIRMIPDIINNFLQSLVSFKRIQDFLQCKEIVNYIQEADLGYAIDIKSASFAWESAAEQSTGELTETKTILKDIDLKVKKGEFIAIVGRVGSGKSSLIQALIQNMNLIKTSEYTHACVSGSIAYVSQESWIQNTTIKNNILFGSEDNNDKYQKVIYVSQLNSDLDILPARDATEIGEKGINLSGGQKTRVAIARAVYSDADIYLLDDPLSAVDAHVGSEIFHKCFKDYLRSKTVILVTNNQQFLQYTDKIIMMNEGRIIETGTFEELIEKNGFFKNSFLVEAHQKVETNSNKPDTVDEKKQESTAKEKKIIEVEDRVVGGVKFSVYKTYLSYSGGGKVFFLVILFMTFWQIDRMYTDLYLSEWTDQSVEEQKENLWENVIIYSIGSLSVNLFILFRLMVTVSGGLRATKIIFREQIEALVNAPVNKFYDVTPTGRILNRLSKDQNAIDTMLLFALNGFIGQVFTVFSIVCLVGWIVPRLLIAIPPALYLAFRIQNFYLTSSREIMRLESISRSPIIQNFSETVSGLSIVRAFGRQEIFYKKNEELLNKNTGLYFYQQACSCWLGISLEIVSDIVLTGSSLYIVSQRGMMEPGLASVCLAYAITLPENFYWLVFSSSMLENNMVSVERCHQLGQTQSEALRIRYKDSDLISRNWPEKGEIEFEKYQMKYRDDTEMVLKGVTGKIKSKEKIGIVGRTGSGKSSICLSLFRIIEPYSGRIIIDGVDVEEIGLDLLRKKMCVIPQEPTLFQATLRDNLDPFHEHSNEKLAEALKLVNVFPDEDLAKALDKEVKEGGNNFSAGQRQLICIARALLRNSKIVFLDEATASIDYKTDALIQEVIKKEFKDCTVITIAHRINTIMEYDRIIVMDNGVIAEFDTPDNLMQKKGIFYSLVNKHKSL